MSSNKISMPLHNVRAVLKSAGLSYQYWYASPTSSNLSAVIEVLTSDLERLKTIHADMVESEQLAASNYVKEHEKRLESKLKRYK